MQRYFVESSNIINGYVYINGEDYHHITKVMRMKIDDEIIVCDNQDSYLCKIIEINAECVTSQIFKKLDEKKELPVNVTIAQGVVRREKAEEVIDKITQLGANKYLMVNMERCNVKLNDEKLNKKVDRMNKIAKEASEQSHRTRKLVVENPIDFKNLLKLKNEYDLCLYAYEVIDKDESLKNILKQKKYQNILILVGPEGGISLKEVEMINSVGFIPISLGPRILRTEVAPTYVMAAISYELEI